MPPAIDNALLAAADMLAAARRISLLALLLNHFS
jgi:hypothetical protein